MRLKRRYPEASEADYLWKDIRTAMLTKLFFPTVAGVRVDRVWWQGQTLHLAATTTRRAARCPLCGRRSKRVHSFYARTIADLPCTGARTIIHLQTRRFVCRVRWCGRKIFTERVSALVAPWGRRTVRQREGLQQTGFAVGGAPGTAPPYAMPTAAAGCVVDERWVNMMLIHRDDDRVRTRREEIERAHIDWGHHDPGR